MKNKMLNLIMPMAVIMLGTFGALSTNAMNQRANAPGDRIGYSHIEGENCVEEDVMCTTLPGNPCKSLGGDQLYDSFDDGVSCPNPLNKIQQ